jgi:hypothetical protein
VRLKDPKRRQPEVAIFGSYKTLIRIVQESNDVERYKARRINPDLGESLACDLLQATKAV